MASEDREQGSQPIEPRPMAVRVLAALAIVGIVVLVMWVTVRAGHNINHKVRHDQTTTVAPRPGTTAAP